MQFSTILGLSAIASVASAAFANSTSTAVVTNNATTVITIVSCAHDMCSNVPVTTGVTVVTETRNSEVTVYTTWCPIPSAPVPSTPATPVSETTVHHGTSSETVPASPTTKVPGSSAHTTNPGSSAHTTNPSSPASSGHTTPPANVTTAKVSTYEGAAIKVVPAFAAVAAGIALLI